MRSNDEMVDIFIEARERKGMSLFELSNLTGISKPTLSRYENKSRKIQLSQIEKLSKYLSLSPKYVLGFANSNFVQISDNKDTAVEIENNSQLLSIEKINDIKEIDDGDTIIFKNKGTISLYFFQSDENERIITLTSSNRQINYRYENFNINNVIGKLIIQIDMTNEQ